MNPYMLALYLASYRLGAFRYKPQSTNVQHHAAYDRLCRDVLVARERLESLCW